uniref:Uncharacterized protein n=1 Tax=Anguilla anguilla TaxID=7936 RepID=A0A0E9X9S0_ANGAN
MQQRLDLNQKRKNPQQDQRPDSQNTSLLRPSLSKMAAVSPLFGGPPS